MATALVDLRAWLIKLPRGPIEELDTLRLLLSEAWTVLDGSGATRMAAAKVARLEEATWSPPRLSVMLERHGATVLGSSRAEVQEWTINVDDGSVSSLTRSIRQLRPRNPPYDARAAASEICTAIAERRRHPHVQELGDGIRILVAAALPDSGAKETVAARRKRLRNELRERLKALGYVERRPWHFDRAKENQ